MSKTEAQSEALRLADELMEPTLWPTDIRNLGAAELRRLDAENKALRERLEPQPSADNGDTARMEWLEVRKYRDVRDGGYSASYSIHLPAMAVGPWQKKNGGEFDHQTLREAIDAARTAAKNGGAA